MKRKMQVINVPLIKVINGIPWIEPWMHHYCLKYCSQINGIFYQHCGIYIYISTLLVMIMRELVDSG